MVESNESLSKRQDRLIEDLRNTDAELDRLRRHRNFVLVELNAIYPEARQLVKPPKERGTTITIWNYAAQGYECRIQTTAQGNRIISDPNPTFFTNADIAILALCQSGANADKLVALDYLKSLTAHPKRRIRTLAESNFLELTFTLKGS